MSLAFPGTDMDYTTGGDYDPEGIDWLTVTTIGSSVETQVDKNRLGHYRHRDTHVLGPWREGLLP